MPMKSEAQRKFLHANEPKVAKEFEEKTPQGKKLPEKVKKMSTGGEVRQEGFAKIGKVKKSKKK